MMVTDQVNEALRALAERVVPFLRDEANKYEDDGSNEPLELAREIESLLAGAEATPVRGVVGELARIGELIRTQDNRITDAPIFIVQQKRKICGIDADYTNTFEWLDPRDTSEVYDDAAKAERDAERAEEGLPPIEWLQGGYIEIWEFVTACFTEQGCKDYLARDGHNLREPRIYAAGSYRNHEWRTVRDALKAAQPAVPSVPEGYYLASFKHGRNDGAVMWWMPNNAGYSHDLEQAGIYHDLEPGYHDSEHTVPVPVSVIDRLRVRRVVDYGDSLNIAFHNAKSLRAYLAATQGVG